MFHGTTTTDLQVHALQLNERQAKAARYHALTRDAGSDTGVKKPSLAQRLATRFRTSTARRTLAPQP